MGDLLALALWSLPFGPAIGTACVVVRSAERPEARTLRMLVATVMGALLGLLWTLLMAWMMGAGCCRAPTFQLTVSLVALRASGGAPG